MQLKNIHISGFGKYVHRDMSFSEGINVIYGENGSGKSTLHAYFKSMLFGMEQGHNAGHDLYSRYLPWDTQASYGGSLTISLDNENYQVERCLETQNPSLSIKKTENGKQIAAKQEELDTLLGHISEETYRNTISIEQLKAATEGSLSETLKNQLSSLALSGTPALDVKKAFTSLREQKKALKHQIDTEAAARYHTVLAEINSIEETLKDMGNRPDSQRRQMNDVEKLLETENSKRYSLEKTIEASKKAIEENSLFAVGDIELYQERLHDAYTAHRMASGEGPDGKKRGVRIRDVLFGIFATSLFLVLALGSLFYEELPFTDTPFPLPKLPLLIVFFAGTGIAFLFTILLFIRSKKEDSASEAMAAETEQFIKNEFETHLGNSEITENARTSMENKFSEYRSLLDSHKKNQELLEETFKSIAGLQEELQETREEIDHFQEEAREFEHACKNLAKLEEDKQSLARIIENNQVLEEKIQAVAMAEETISSLASRIHETFSPLLNSRVSEIMAAITNGLYDQFHVDEKLTITVKSGGRSVSLDSLSRGTIEQVYLALRVSAVEILFPDQALPILLDDTFAYYDDTRLNNTLKWLVKAYPGQIFLFTSHKREAAFLSRMNVPYQLLVLN